MNLLVSSCETNQFQAIALLVLYVIYVIKFFVLAGEEQHDGGVHTTGGDGSASDTRFQGLGAGTLHHRRGVCAGAGTGFGTQHTIHQDSFCLCTCPQLPLVEGSPWTTHSKLCHFSGRGNSESLAIKEHSQELKAILIMWVQKAFFFSHKLHAYKFLLDLLHQKSQM